MPDRLEGRLRWLFGGVAVVLVTAGAYALLAIPPANPAQAGSDVAATTTLVALAVMALVTTLALGVLVVWSPRRHTHLMPIFTLATASATVIAASATWAAWDDVAARTVLLLATASGVAMTAATALGWRALWLAPEPGVATATRDAELLEALLATMVPPGVSGALDASDASIRTAILDDFRALGGRRRPALRLVLRVLDLVSRVKHRSGFVRAELATREALLAGLATSRVARLRAVRELLDAVVARRFYGDPRVREQIGDQTGWVEERIAAGPNADLHRARREAAEQAAAEAALVAAGVAERSEDAEADPVTITQATPPVAEHHEPAPRRPSALAPVTPPLVSAAGSAQTSATDDVPFDRAWTLGVPQEPARPTIADSQALAGARAGGPTRP